MMIDVKNESVFDYVDLIRASDESVLGYFCFKDATYYSPRYKKHITFEAGENSDGATGAKDLDSFSWLIHDKLCAEGVFDGGTKCANLQASAILSDILAEEGRWFRRCTWFVSTWLLGGGKARDNGMF